MLTPSSLQPRNVWPSLINFCFSVTQVLHDHILYNSSYTEEHLFLYYVWSKIQALWGKKTLIFNLTVQCPAALENEIWTLLKSVAKLTLSKKQEFHPFCIGFELIFYTFPSFPETCNNLKHSTPQCCGQACFSAPQSKMWTSDSPAVCGKAYQNCNNETHQV